MHFDRTRRRGWQSWALLLSALLLALPAWAVDAGDEPARAPASSDAASLKAAFLYNFAQYATWPGMGDHFVLCVLGRHDLGAALDALSTRRIDGKPVRVKQVDSAADARACQLLFVPDANADSLPAVARALQAQPVLVVSDYADSAIAWAMIVIEREGNRLAFSVNLTRVRSAGLDISARLLRLARGMR